MRPRKAETELTDTERTRLADELAALKGEVRSLRAERDQTKNLYALRSEIEELKLSKDRLVEDNDRKIGETEHKVGLLKVKQDHDVEHARREAMLGVREENLKADQERFKGE